jgi:predicted RND superfamily exporter protein/lauroyl/myristoyl acyltransferase
MKQSRESHVDPSNPSLKHPGRWFWLILLLPIALGLARLRFDVEIFDLLPSNLAAVEGLKLYQQYFANARELIISVKAPSPEDAEAGAREIAQALRTNTVLITAATWEPPWLEHPDQAAELMAYLWLNQPPNVFAELTNRLAPEKLETTLNAAREELASSLSPEDIARLSYDPFGLTRLPETVAGAAPSFSQGQDMFSSSDGKFRIIFVQARPELRTYRDCAQWLETVKTIATTAVGAIPNSGGVSLGFTGRPAFFAEVAAGMEHDIATSVGGTAVIIAFLFWLAHRRIKPMLWLLTLLALILGSTLALGGLIFGTINVVSMGFAAILLGLAVDYAVVHYQEALAHPNLSIPQIRHAIAPSILWAAVTTITAFLVLNFGGLPGLGQLGSLVGLGVALAALIMIFEFLPPLFPGRNAPHGNGRETIAEGGVRTPDLSHAAPIPLRRRRWVLPVSAAVLLCTILVLMFGLPPIDTTANALRPRKSQAYTTLDEIQAHLNQKREPVWLVIGGDSVEAVAQRLDQVQSTLARATSNQLLEGYTLPTPLWPRPEYQAENRKLVMQLNAERPLLRQAAQASGFAPASLGFTERLLDTWFYASQQQTIFWPTNPMSEWILQKVVARTHTNDFALGLLNPVVSADASANLVRLARLEAELPKQDVWLSGWQLLGHAIFSRVRSNMWKVVAPMIVLVLLSLFLAFRRPSEILLSLAVLFLSGLCLLAVMRLVGWRWNLLNLMAVPLVLGTGVDYSIFMQLALRRYHGDLEMAYRSVGRALLLCGGTAIAGFGSLAVSSNAGMASLGQVCAVGIGSNMLIAIFLLPVWWERLAGDAGKSEIRNPKSETNSKLEGGKTQNGQARQFRALPFRMSDLFRVSGLGHRISNPSFAPQHSTPSALYRSEFWRLGQWTVRLLPQKLCLCLCWIVARIYWTLARHRLEVVTQNLLPPFKGDVAAAENKAKELFQQFALKLLDLWRYEGGLSIDGAFGEMTGWAHFTDAQAQGRGVLLLTPHLGNWEFGGPLLTQKGVGLQVITLAEPGDEFTAMRQASRARWNIETLVIGSDPMAFLEVIRRLEKGATVALLVDRPPPPTAVTVQLFGKPFLASIAAAELARASGCALLPVYLPRQGEKYDAHILPAIAYERAKLRDREHRRLLTQSIIQVFEPLILKHLDQWYHFVPVWPQNADPTNPIQKLKNEKANITLEKSTHGGSVKRRT